MKMRTVILCLGLLTGSVWIPAEAGNPEENLLGKAREKALPVAKELMQTLEGRLREAMGKGGPMAAIEVCQEQALELTETVRREKDVAYLKRVGVRLRNPENAPDAHEERALAHFLDNAGENGAFPADWAETVELPDGSRQIRYYRAIPMQARCLPCHGPAEQMPQKVRETIDTLYPHDKARGFEQGQLRGLLVIGLDPESID